MATWHTVAALKRQYIAAEVTNANGFVVVLPGTTEWTNPKFFISVKEMILPLIMSSLTYNIAKVASNQYRIQPIIEGSVEKIYEYTQYVNDKNPWYLPSCYGFNLSVGGAGELWSGFYSPWVNKQTFIFNQDGTIIETVLPSFTKSQRIDMGGSDKASANIFVSDYSITSATPQRYGISNNNGRQNDKYNYYQRIQYFVQCYEYAQYVATDAKLTVLCIEQ